MATIDLSQPAVSNATSVDASNNVVLTNGLVAAGPIKAAAGSAGAPSITFPSSQTMGLYDRGSGAFGVSCGGNDIASYDSGHAYFYKPIQINGVGVTFSVSGSIGVANGTTTFTIAGGIRQQLTKTAAYTMTWGDSFSTINNNGAGSQVVITMPTASAGAHGRFVNTDGGATFLKLQAAGTDKFAQAGTLGAATGSLTSASIWSVVEVECVKNGVWLVVNTIGTAWTLA